MRMRFGVFRYVFFVALFSGCGLNIKNNELLPPQDTVSVFLDVENLSDFDVNITFVCGYETESQNEIILANGGRHRFFVSAEYANCVDGLYFDMYPRGGHNARTRKPIFPKPGQIIELMIQNQLELSDPIAR